MNQELTFLAADAAGLNLSGSGARVRNGHAELCRIGDEARDSAQPVFII